jgi:hypothetical protein
MLRPLQRIAAPLLHAAAVIERRRSGVTHGRWSRPLAREPPGHKSTGRAARFDRSWRTMQDPLQALRDALLTTHHVGRIERMLALGTKARTDPHALATIDALAARSGGRRATGDHPQRRTGEERLLASTDRRRGRGRGSGRGSGEGEVQRELYTAGFGMTRAGTNSPTLATGVGTSSSSRVGAGDVGACPGPSTGAMGAAARALMQQRLTARATATDSLRFCQSSVAAIRAAQSRRR